MRGPKVDLIRLFLMLLITLAAGLIVTGYQSIIMIMLVSGFWGIAIYYLIFGD